MEELYDKVNNLISKLDDNSLIKEIKDLTEKVSKDKDLMKLLEKYQLTKDEKVKKEIISNELFQEYKSKETDLNILIMAINQKLKTINNERSCQK